MSKPLPITFFLLFLTMFSVAQQKSRYLIINVFDAVSNLAIENSNLSVSILHLPDSVLLKNFKADEKINPFTGLKDGEYLLRFRATTYKDKLEKVWVKDGVTENDLHLIFLQPQIVALKEVLVTAMRSPINIKKDTTEFDTRAYFTQLNDNVEALLKKIPGIEISKDGKITVQGKPVSKILVDGKEFFGNDTKAATKNLPADAIGKVQVIDDKTDKIKNTGIDDGQREKVINLELKDDRKNGWFGNLESQAGTNSRYLAQANLNQFNDRQQVSFILLDNNINETGFTLEDLNNFTGGSTYSYFGSGNGTLNFNVSNSGRVNINNAFSGVEGGVITGHTLGVNYSKQLGKRKQLKINVSLMGILTSNTVQQLTGIDDIPNNLLTNQSNNSNNRNNVYRMNINVDYTIDTLTSIRFKPVFSLMNKKSDAMLFSQTLNHNMDSVNTTLQTLNQHSTNPAIGGQFTINRKLSHGRGSLNFYAIGNYADIRGGYNNATMIKSPATVATTDTLQQVNQNVKTRSITGTLSFVKVLSKKKKINLTLSESADYHHDIANQYALDYNAVTGMYDFYDYSYNGNFSSDNYRYTSTAGLNKTSDKLMLTANIALAGAGIDGSFQNTLTSNLVNRRIWSFIPNASALYRPKKGESLYSAIRFDFVLPSVVDLQPVLNNTNPLYVRSGNPSLQIAHTLNLNFNFSNYNSANYNLFSFYGNYTHFWNGFSTSSKVDSSGITHLQPINVNGNYLAAAGINWGLSTRIKGLKINLGASPSFSHNVNIINDNPNTLIRMSGSVNAGINYDASAYQFSFKVSPTFNNASNSFEHLADQQYFSSIDELDLNWNPRTYLRIYSEITQSLYRGEPVGSNTSFYLWNAGIERYFLKKQNLTVALGVYDLLDQNAGISRLITNLGQIQNTQTNTLSRFYFIKVVYKIAKLGK